MFVIVDRRIMTFQNKHVMWLVDLILLETKSANTIQNKAKQIRIKFGHYLNSFVG